MYLAPKLLQMKSLWLRYNSIVFHEEHLSQQKNRGSEDSLYYQLENCPQYIAVSVSLPSGCPVETGHTLRFYMKANEVSNFIATIQLQWVLTQIASISAFAGILELQSDEGSDLDKWLQSQI
ncbi:hypothetical protein N7495_001868 [Penicillium taxi]|uniref:uncharacterized protein n=1 Tax=Penicillium taxi TaxID=168475 RepID=UPI0025459593|nr:uncharacterized protein N7495_001868 [Penicillium taxi]KAJ5909186.1 hypothetical protein N7495_001868 [Penicillium taxi]